MMWYHDFKTKALTRILETPYGSEVTSPYWYPNIHGWSYLITVIQHPYGESDEAKMCAPVFACAARRFDVCRSVNPRNRERCAHAVLAHVSCSARGWP
jgi:hypothetical protein